jgi:putative peptidoglycan lipid II flippase
MMLTLALAAWFPTAGHAAAWGVLLAGCLEVMLVGGDAARNGLLPTFKRLHLDDDIRRFFRALGPATLGSGGTQIALFADTLIASFLAAGALSALYYADRLNQLPIGVIGIAVGTVLLPEMASRLASGDDAGAHDAQNRAIEFTLLLSIPCFVAFTTVPDLIMLALFARGAFTAADAAAAGATLSAYAFGLLPFVLLRSVSSTFLARGDTVTPVKALLAASVINVALKILLMGHFAQVGLALATSIGVWVNFGLLLWFALRGGLLIVDERLKASILRFALAGVLLDILLVVATRLVSARWPTGTGPHPLAKLALLGLLGAVVYGGAIATLFGRRWFTAFLMRGGGAEPSG